LGLLSTAAFRTSDDSSNVWKVVQAMESRGIPQILETLTDRWFTDEFIQFHPEVVKKRLNQVIATNPGVFLNVFRILCRYGNETLVARNRMPMTCSYGRE